ncbi:hypothetical protein [Pseudomonas sp. IT-P294]|jgi:hypothetical protein|uniref:hypothetical protein n=1 Tax=Pseudomonas sp. IT-P294 TaxID=3026454 RepID=UPI0039E0769B
MLVFIAFVVALIGFVAMSRPFKIVFALYVGYFVYYLYLYAGKADIEQASTFLTLITGGIGLLIVGGVMGAMRSAAESEQQYVDQRKKVLLFLLKFGGAYVLMTQLATVGLFLAGNGRSWEDWIAASFLVKVTPYKWVAFVLLIAVFYCVKNAIAKRSWVKV